MQEALLPHASIAVQRREITFAPPQVLLTESLKPIVTELQVSVAVAIPVLFVLMLAGHSKVTFVGQVIRGLVVSWTVMVWTQEELLPHASLAVQVREMIFEPPQVLLTESL